MNFSIFEKTFKRGIYEFGCLHGNLWLKIFYHSYKNGTLFSSPDEAKYVISVEKYSIFANISEKFKVDQKYEFMIYYPEENIYFRWYQNDNPIDEKEEESKTQADGFEDKSPTEGYQWGGLVLTTIKDQGKINSLLNGNPGSHFWYFAIGMYEDSLISWKEKGIPSYRWEYSTKIVSVWLRLPFPLNLLHFCNRHSQFSFHSSLPLFLSIFIGNS